MWIKLDLSYPSHRKTRRFVALMGGEKSAAWWPVMLWAYAAQNQPDGDFSGYSEEEIAQCLGFDGDPARLVDCLKRVNFLNKDTMQIHGWEEHASFHIGMKQRARDAANARWKKKNTDATSIAQALPEQSPSNASSMPQAMPQASDKHAGLKEKGSQKETERREERRGEDSRIASGMPQALLEHPTPEPPDLDVIVQKTPAALPLPSLDECQTYARSQGWPEEEAEKFWHDAESVGWRVRGENVVNWKSRLKKWMLQRFEFQNNSKGGPAPSNTPRKTLLDQEFEKLTANPTETFPGIGPGINAK